MTRWRPFIERLALARELVDHASEIEAGVPTHRADQLEAAAHEAAWLGRNTMRAVQALELRRGWHALSGYTSYQQKTYLLAALLDASPCVHLRREGPQPAFVRLALRRADCQRCIQVHRLPPPDEADRCDVCGERGVDWFVPFVVTMGSVVMGGEVCSECAAVLIPREAAAA